MRTYQALQTRIVPFESTDTVRQFWMVGNDSERRADRRTVVSSIGGVRLREFNTISDSISALEASAHNPDVILLHVSTSQDESLSSIRDLKRRSRDTGVLVISAGKDRKTLFEALKAGASGFIHSPDGLDELPAAIDRLVEGGYYVDGPSLRTLIEGLVAGTRTAFKYGLTPRESEILSLISKGLTRARIATHLSLSLGTVLTHYRTIYRKLDVHKISDAVGKAVKEGLV